MSLFKFGWFASHSGFQLPWKVDCDALSDDDIEAIASILQWKFAFSEALAVPSRGDTPAPPRLAAALQKHLTPGYGPLIVDDVVTTGRSMEEFRAEVMRNRPAVPAPIGFAIVARCPKDGANLSVPDWVFTLVTVNEWSQSRATGLG